MSMNRFLELLRDLDEHTGTLEKEKYISQYIHDVSPLDAAWATYLLVGKRQRKAIGSAKLKSWAREISGLPEWLFDESYSAVGDLAETITLVVSNRVNENFIKNLLIDFDHLELSLAEYLTQVTSALKDASDETSKKIMMQLWHTQNRNLIFFMTKILTGSFRIGVSVGLMQRAIAKAFNRTPADVADLLIGNWHPSAELFLPLLSESVAPSPTSSKPYPFCLASPLTDELASLGSAAEWLAEWKWDGMRAQIIRSENQIWIWSRGEELISDSFPDLQKIIAHCPSGTILDGEIVAWGADHIASFAKLQKRLGRKSPSEKFCAANPVRFIAYDCLRFNHEDIRSLEFSRRREILTSMVVNLNQQSLLLSEPIPFTSWEDLKIFRDLSRSKNVEGLMLKKLDSVYKTGRKRGIWWKWKIDPYEVDAVLLYAQPGHGRRANLYTDYTFAVWDKDVLVPFAKAYSGLTDEEIVELDKWIRAHTKEKFGPVRSLEAFHVFELHFEAIALSGRHKSGISVRFPRISRWRKDKKPEDADSLEGLKKLLKAEIP